MPKSAKLLLLSASVLGEQKPPLAHHDSGSLTAWQQGCNPRQASPCQGGSRALSAERCLWLPGPAGQPVASAAGTGGGLSLPVSYSFCRQNSSNSSNSLDPHGTTFPKCISAWVIFLKIKTRCIRKELEQKKANNLPRSQRSHPNAFPSSWELAGGPASCLWILLYVTLNQTHNGSLLGGGDARDMWDG